MESGPAGRFHFVGIAPFGPYSISTQLEKEGYPDTRWDFYQPRPNMKIVIDADHRTIKGLSLTIGPKGGTIFGVVRDRFTGGFLTDVGFKVWRVHQKNAWVGFDPVATPAYAHKLGLPPGGFRSLMPSGVEIALSVESKDYKTWYYKDPKTGENSFTLPSGSTKAINVSMTPKE